MGEEDPGEACPCPAVWPVMHPSPPRGQTDSPQHLPVCLQSPSLGREEGGVRKVWPKHLGSPNFPAPCSSPSLSPAAGPAPLQHELPLPMHVLPHWPLWPGLPTPWKLLSGLLCPAALPAPLSPPRLMVVPPAQFSGLQAIHIASGLSPALLLLSSQEPLGTSPLGTATASSVGGTGDVTAASR